jgi:hypothetical protein
VIVSPGSPFGALLDLCATSTHVVFQHISKIFSGRLETCSILPYASRHMLPDDLCVLIGSHMHKCIPCPAPVVFPTQTFSSTLNTGEVLYVQIVLSCILFSIHLWTLDQFVVNQYTKKWLVLYMGHRCCHIHIRDSIAGPVLLCSLHCLGRLSRLLFLLGYEK